MANKKGANASNAQRDAAASASSASSLIICRNKHWRYISSFHGPWLQLPPEILESLAHQNYTQPAPRLIDPAVFYDVVKIRRAVDEASEDAVRASNGMSTTGMNGSLNFLDPFGQGGPQAPKMSKERIYKIRQKAARLLSKAYALDEVAASVATMQSTSSLEEVAQHVLRRDQTDTEAKYVHFFHEKIPSRKVDQYTPLESLDDVILNLPWEQQGAPLRTRALVQIFKGQFGGAASDLTFGLRIAQKLKDMHKSGGDQLVLAKHYNEEQERWNRSGRDWRHVPQLKEEDQPSSLEQQLLFNRAGVYLSIACQSIHAALDGLKEAGPKDENGDKIPSTARERDAHQARLDARKVVKTNAKKALKDYLAFLSYLDYTPGLPVEIVDEITRRINDLANGNKQTTIQRNRLIEWNSHSSSGRSTPTIDSASRQSTRASDSSLEWDADGWPRIPHHKIYSSSALFAEKPIPDLPVFPDTEGTSTNESPFSIGTREAVTYHPLLTDALHSLLLAHTLLQTSPTELLRHAHNAARLARLADGYPIFQAARSPARSDWIEVLQRANNWIGLSQPWQKLCQPAPLSTQPKQDAAAGAQAGSVSAGALTMRNRYNRETGEQKRERIKDEAIIDAMGDERVIDQQTFDKAVRAREQRAMEDEEGLSGPLHNGDKNRALDKRWAQDDSKEYPISSDRAEAVCRWIREAPLSMSVRKRRPVKKKKLKKPVADGPDSVTEGLKNMHVHVSSEQVD
ncbi:hypothetical protein E4T39_08656 [Aureobasidium subglaciale]|nr:hypothetical protein E4T39_08656 [Aureobasidium subglaciale]